MHMPHRMPGGSPHVHFISQDNPWRHVVGHGHIDVLAVPRHGRMRMCLVSTDFVTLLAHAHGAHAHAHAGGSFECKGTCM